MTTVADFHLHGFDVSQVAARVYRDVATPDEGCWLWIGAKSNGYGKFGFGGEIFYAHRIAWEIAHGPIPRGYRPHHECETPSCIRPSHTRPVTAREHAAEHGLSGVAVIHAAKTHCACGRPLEQIGRQRGCYDCDRRRKREWARQRSQEQLDRVNARRRELRATRTPA